MTRGHYEHLCRILEVAEVRATPTGDADAVVNICSPNANDPTGNLG
jgi:hypothetical protein